MSVTAFCQVIQSQWQALAEYVWPETPEQRTQKEIARRTADLAQRYRRLLHGRQRIEALRDRIARQEREQRGEFRVRTQQRLTDLEARYARQREEYLRRKQVQLALLRGQLVVCTPLSSS